MNKADLVTQVMTHKSIPPGQLYLYKALYEAPPEGLTLEDLSEAGDRTVGEVQRTLGGLG